MNKLVLRQIAKPGELVEKSIGDLLGMLDQIKNALKTTEELTNKARMIALMMLGVTLLLIGIIIFIYVHRLTGKIKLLTEVAERISLGELEVEVEAKSRDEIGELAEAIARMQENIRLSIERLQRLR